MQWLPEELEVLSRMVEVQGKVGKLSNEQLAQLLVDLTENLNIESYHYQTLMEAAYRLDPKSFEEA